MCDRTPRAVIELPTDAAAPHLAREFLKSATCPLHGSALLDDAVLLASEAVTNALVHGRSPIVLSVDCIECDTEIRVRDGSVALPRNKHANGTALGGRGVMMIDMLAAAWGVDLIPHKRGKEVWFRLHATV